MLTFNETVISRQPAIFSHPFCLKHLIAVSSRWPRGPLVLSVFQSVYNNFPYGSQNWSVRAYFCQLFHFSPRYFPFLLAISIKIENRLKNQIGETKSSM